MTESDIRLGGDNLGSPGCAGHTEVSRGVREASCGQRGASVVDLGTQDVCLPGPDASFGWTQVRR